MEFWIKLLLFLNVLMISAGRHFDVETNVSCVVDSSCILACSYESEMETTIQWNYKTGEEEEVNVHSFYDDQDQVGFQDPRFQGRTSLVEDQKTRRRTHLMLKKVKVQDEGTYRCSTRTDRRCVSVYVHLQVLVSGRALWDASVILRMVVAVFGISVGVLVLLCGLWFLQRGVVTLIGLWTSHGEKLLPPSANQSV